MADDREQIAEEGAEAAETPTSAVPPSSEIVDKWFRTFVCGSVASRDTEAFNYLAGVAVIELKRLLAGEKHS